MCYSAYLSYHDVGPKDWIKQVVGFAFTHKAILSPQPSIFDQKSFYSQGKLNTNPPIRLLRVSFT